MEKSLLNKCQVHLTLLTAVAIFIAGCLYVYDFYIDDAFISLRFAKNLVDYGQLSFNPGDSPIEGYTNFLLVVLEALFIKAGVSNVLQIPKITGILSGILLVIVIYKISVRLLPEKEGWIRYLPLFAAAVSPSLIVWAVGGLETNLFLLLLVCGIYYFISSLESNTLQDVLLSDIFFMLAFLCRPDAILLWGIGYLFLLCFSRKVAWRNRVISLFIMALLMSAYLAWKYFYFGSLLPTTFYAKVNSLTADRLKEGLYQYYYFLRSNLNFLYFALLPLTFRAILRKPFSGWTYLLTLFLGYSAYVIYLGNPVMGQAFRFYVPLIPTLNILGACGLAIILKLDKYKEPRLKNVLVGGVIVLQLIAGIFQLHYYQEVDFGWVGGFSLKGVTELSEFNSNLGIWINETFPPKTVIAIGDVGAIGYYSNGKIIDTWSLMDKKLIQFRTEQQKYPEGSTEYLDIEKQKIAKYILDQNPGIIMLDYVDYSADPRAYNYVMFTDLSRDDKPLFIREDLLGRPAGSQDLRLIEIKSGFGN